MFKSKKHKLQFFALCTGFLAMTLGVLFSSGKGLSYFVRGLASRNLTENSITLNSSNKQTTAGDFTKKTKKGNDVVFTYSNVLGSTSGHATLNNGGYIVNKDRITSIDTITVEFSVSSAGYNLKLKSSYDGSTWSDEWNAVSGETYFLSSNPYFIQLTATGGTVNIENVVYSYTCVTNSAANPTPVVASESWSLVTDLNDVEANDEVLITGYRSSVYYTLQNAELTNWYYLDAKSITVSNGVASKTSTNHAWTVEKTSSGKFKFKNGSNYLYGGHYNGSYYNIARTAQTGLVNEWTVSLSDGAITMYATSSDDYSAYLEFYVYNSTPEFRGVSEYKYNKLYMFKHITVTEDAYNVPVDAVGFTASDSNANSYTTNSIFDIDNNLSVQAIYSDSSMTTLNPGVNGYSYVVINSLNETIDTSKAFAEEGIYTLIVSYGTYIPIEIQLNVTFELVLTEISVHSSTLSFNTAQKLSDYTSGITVDLSYNRSSDNETGVAYSSFASKNLSMTLISPSSVDASISTVFGVAGTWKIKVSSTTNPSVFGILEITVNAIPVQTISVTGGEATVEEGKTLQLTATVSPNTATTQTVTWSSNNENVATVNNTGLVTGVSVGNARITATATDGSATFGYLDITVTEKVAGADEGTYLLSNSSTLEVGSYVVFTTKTSEGSGYAMSKTQSANNRPGVEITINNGSLERDVNSSFAAFKVEEGTSSGSYAFYDENAEGYLSAVGGGNYLRTVSTKSANTSFTISGSTEKTIISVASVDQKYLKWNPTATLFSCYKSSSSNMVNGYIYEKGGDPVYPTAISLSGSSSVGVGSTITLSVTYTPSETTVKSVSWSSSDDTIAGVENGVVTGIKAGTATITATATGAGGAAVVATKQITVSNIAVSSVSLNTNSLQLNAGGTSTLVPTISPNNATNTNVSWSTSDNSVATVDNGVVTAHSSGTAIITVTTADGGKTATCTVTVAASSTSSGSDVINKDETSSGIGNTGQSSWALFSISLDSGAEYTIRSMGISGTNYALKWNANGYIYSTVSGGEITRIDAVTNDKAIDFYGSNTAFSSNEGGTKIGSVSGSNGFDTSGYEYIRIVGTTGSTYVTSITITYGTPEPVEPTAISITPSSFELSKSGSKTLSVSYTPTNANTKKAITWSSSNENVATVDTSGKVTAKSNASVGQTATITARLTEKTSVYATATLTIAETAKADHTVLVYICGADLESGQYRLASGDISEMLSVSGQPSDVNVVIETGGAKSWGSTHGISSTYLQRHHIANKKLVTDVSNLTYQSMGNPSTLQSFIEYGIENYPANRYGLILWNHGGGMRGVCYDEKKNDDVLLNSEIHSAVGNALNNKGMSGEKFEWIGYDACLMAVQDIAITNSDYFNYMIASEESEAGEGWDYDTWLDDLYAKKSTENILKAIVDGFIADNGGASANGSDYDQTLSYLDLSYASAYKTAWENLASQLNTTVTNSNKASFNSAITSNVKHFAGSDYDYFCTFDAWDFVDKLANNSAFNSFKVNSTYTTAVKNAFANLVKYSVAQKGAGAAKGLCMYWPNSSQYSDVSTYYTTSETTLTTWRSFCVNKGTHA